MTYSNSTTIQKTFLTLFVGIGILFLQFFPAIVFAELDQVQGCITHGGTPSVIDGSFEGCIMPFEEETPITNSDAQAIVDALSDEAQAGAGTQGSGVGTQGSGVGTDGSGGGSKSIINPLKFDSIPEFLLAIIDILLTFAIPIIVLFIMYAGYLFATARGNEAQISTARNALLWAIVGGVIVLGAKVIISVIQGTVDAFK